MAKKLKKKTEDVVRTCGECKHHYGDHEIGADGKPFLCHCSIVEKYNKFSRFLDEKACELFEHT